MKITAMCLVKNGCDTYTVDAVSFANTYTRIGPGLFEKFGKVWAEQAVADGAINTKEGITQYKKGDWLVFNQPDSDGYAMSDTKFQSLYELASEN